MQFRGPFQEREQPRFNRDRFGRGSAIDLDHVACLAIDGQLRFELINEVEHGQGALRGDNYTGARLLREGT